MVENSAVLSSHVQRTLLSPFMETSLEAIINYFQNNLWATAVAVFLLTVLALVVHGIWESYSKPLVLEASPIPCGDITIDELGKFDGTDPFKPIYVAIKGNVYDVTKGRDFYGRGEFTKGRRVHFAKQRWGKCACNTCANPQLSSSRSSMCFCGTWCLDILQAESSDLLWASADGGYSVFAGREVARALAKMSLKKDDCNAELADCTEKELESLAQWETKFKEKYSVVGKVSGRRRGLGKAHT